MDVVVTGIGLISALGDLSQTWQRLLAAQSGIVRRQPFDTALPLAMLGPQPADLVNLTATVVNAALIDAGLQAPLADCGVVVGSSRGCQGRIETVLRSESRPKLRPELHPEAGSKLEAWTEMWPNAAAIATARLLQTQAIVLSPMAACATGTWAIAQGFDLIRTGAYERVVAGAVEAPITPLTLAGFGQMGALAKTGAYPFDVAREGLVLGEGGAVLVLESAELAQRRGAKVYGQILGFGLTADGYHVSAPNPEGKSAIAAIQQCLDRSHLAPQDIGYIHAHGTATRLNDRHEAQLIQRLFPQGVSVSSTKGATGHTIGASGALGAAFCLMALRHQILPPNVGLRRPELALDWVRFVRKVGSVRLRHALSLSFGFGGQNAVVAIAAPAST